MRTGGAATQSRVGAYCRLGLKLALNDREGIPPDLTAMKELHCLDDQLDEEEQLIADRLITAAEHAILDGVPFLRVRLQVDGVTAVEAHATLEPIITRERTRQREATRPQQAGTWRQHVRESWVVVRRQRLTELGVTAEAIAEIDRITETRPMTRKEIARVLNAHKVALPPAPDPSRIAQLEARLEAVESHLPAVTEADQIPDTDLARQMVRRHQLRR